MTDDIVRWPVSARQVRRWRSLKLVSAIPVLSLPVDLLLGNWVSGSVDRKATCYTPLPGYQTALASIVPVLFVMVALTCAVAAAVTVVRGRRRKLPAQRVTGRSALALSLPALAISAVSAVPALLAVGFSTWCF